MPLTTQIASLATRIATEIKAVRSELASGLSGKANTSHTHAQSDVTGLATSLAGKANLFVYTLPNTMASSAWIRLGTWTTTQDGQGLLIRITSKAGYNANSDQDQFTTLRFKTSNGGAFQAGSSGNFFGDGTASVDTGLGGAATAPSTIRVVQLSNTSYEFWGQFGTYTGGHFYEVITPSGTTWTNSASTGTPSGNSIDIVPNAGSRILNISANYTLTTAERGKTVVSTGGAITVTVPAVLNVGERIDFIQDGTGQITFAASGITLASSGGLLKTANRYAGATIICVAANQYRLIGNLG